MPEHSIRLRGGWEWQDLSLGSENQRRLTLPMEWSGDQDGPVFLTRRFNTPPIDPRCDSLFLRMAKVPGLLAVRLNGSAVEGPLDSSLTLDFRSFGTLVAKYVLILEVDPARATRGGEGWGEIALVVVARENHDDDANSQQPS